MNKLNEPLHLHSDMKKSSKVLSQQMQQTVNKVNFCLIIQKLVNISKKQKINQY